MSIQNQLVRYHSLDALRAFALLLGVVFHAAESFVPNNTFWAIADQSPSVFLTAFRHASHSFRLEIFFLIAGFFAHLVIQRRGVNSFIKNRIQRILVPLIVGWIILFPLLAYLWVWGSLKSGNFTFLPIPEELRHLPAWQLTLGFFISLEFIKHFDLTHLWFLHQLLSIYAIIFIVRWLFVSYLDRDGNWRLWMDQIFAGWMRSCWNVVLFAIPTMFMLMGMDSWSVDTPRESLIPYVPTTIFYGFFFSVGWFLHRRVELLDEFTRRWRLHLMGAFLFVFPTFFFGSIAANLGFDEVYNFAGRIVYTILYALMMWLWVFGVTGIFLHYCKNENPVRRYIADSSYWLYIVHLPVVVVLQILFAYVDLVWPVKFLLINLAAFPILFLSYHYLVRSTFIGATLNGRRYPRS